MIRNSVIRLLLRIDISVLFLIVSLNCMGAGQTFSVKSIEGYYVDYTVYYGDTTVLVGYLPGNSTSTAVSRSINGKLTIPDEVEYQGKKYKVSEIGDKAFKDCSLLTEVVLPKYLHGIRNNAFENCTALHTIDLPENLVGLYSSVFSGCTSLTSIEIPTGIHYVSHSIFKDCTSLKSVYIKTDSLTYIGEYAFSGCSVLDNIDFQHDKIKFNGYIDEYAFAGCSNLKSLKIPEGVIGIKESAFRDCSSITDMTIPNTVVGIENSAFYGCSNLVNIVLPNTITNIDDNIFYDCSRLVNIVIPNTVTSIGNNAFGNCGSLTNIAIPNSVMTIGESSFQNCGLSKIDIPSSVISIGGSAFRSCSNLENVSINANIDCIQPYLFYGCKNLLNVSIPKSVTMIGIQAFGNCANLENIVIPDCVTSIDDRAFEYCSNLKLETLPKELKSIGLLAFGFCQSLTSIVIPKGVETIGGSVFYDCINLTSVYVRNPNPIDNNASFKSIASNSILYVPYTALDAYKNNYWWKNQFGSIKEDMPQFGDSFIASANSTQYIVEIIGNNPLEVDIKSLDGTTVEGDYEMPTLVWGPDNKQFVVSSISSSAFNGSNMNSLIISENVKVIADAAFSNCTMLDSIFIPKKVERLGANFVLCNNLHSVTVNWRNPSDVNVSMENFSDIPDFATLYVPAGTYERYASHGLWSRFAQIVEVGPIHVGDIQSVPNSQIDLPLYLKTTDGIAGLQFKLTLPNGISVLEDSGNLDVSVTNRTDGFTVIGNKDPDSENSYIFAALSLDGEAIKGHEGAILNIKLDIAQDLGLGDYEMGIEDVYLATTSFETLSPIAVTSDLSIVNEFDLIYMVDGVEYNKTSVEFGSTITALEAPTKEGYTFSGWSEIPSTMPAENVVITGYFISNKLVLTDGEIFENDEVRGLDEITYTRTLNNTEWNALYLPFEVSVSQLLTDYEVAYINAVHSYDDDDNGEIDRMSMEVIKIKNGTLHANHPYMIKARNEAAKQMNITVTGATLHKSENVTLDCSSIYTKYEITGIYNKMTGSELSGCYALSGGSWKQIASNSYLSPFRMYLRITPREGSPYKVSPLAMTRISIHVKGEEGSTSIEELLQEQPKEEVIYDLMGRLVETPVKGQIYIVGGKKRVY